MIFETHIDPRRVSVSGIEKLSGLLGGSDYEIEPDNFTVTWTLDLETRSWGVKYLHISVRSIVGEFDIVYLDAQGDETSRESVELDYAHFLYVVKEFEVGAEGGCPQSLDIEYDRKKIVVS